MADSQSDRLKDTYAELLIRQAGEALELASDARLDPDLGHALGGMLRRIADAARSLQIASVEQSASAALDTLDRGADAVDAIGEVLANCQALDGVAPALRPVFVVAPAQDVRSRLRAQADTVGANVEIFETVADALWRAHFEPPSAYIIPATGVRAAVRTGIDVRRVPLYVYGVDTSLRDRVRAATEGAAGYLPTPLDLIDALPRMRYRLPAEQVSAWQLLYVDSNRQEAAAFEMIVGCEDIRVEVVEDGATLLEAVENHAPDLILIAPSVGEYSPVSLAAAMQGHHRWGHIPVVLLVDGANDELTGLFSPAAGVLRRDIDQDMFSLRTRIRGVLQRSRRDRRFHAFDLSTGVLGRAALLRAADREIAAARQSGAQLAVARIEISEPGLLRSAYGQGTVERALGVLARCMRESLRETDIVGRLGANGLVALIPNCSMESAANQAAAIRKRFAWAAGQDHALMRVSLATGVADTVEGIDDVLLRADRNLLRARGR
jgi:diguanylate cyclase (GGDEF)-like protein